MGYQDTKNIMLEHNLSDEDVQQLMEAFARETREQEPHVINPINAAQQLAESFITEE